MKIAIGNRVINTLQSDNPYNRLFLCALDDMAMKLMKEEDITANVFAVTAAPTMLGAERCSIEKIDIMFEKANREPHTVRKLILRFYANDTRYRNRETEAKVIDLLQLPLHESEEAIFKGELSIAVAPEFSGWYQMRWMKIADIMDGIRMVLIKGAPTLDAFTPDYIRCVHARHERR